jgi:hypothetical protein
MMLRDLYGELAAQLDALNPQLEALRPKTPAERIKEIDELFELESECCAEIDNAFGQYIATGIWPALEHKKTILICVRLGHAAQFLEFLLKSPDVFHPQIEDSQKAKFLRFLFVEYGHFAGYSRWRTT